MWRELLPTAAALAAALTGLPAAHATPAVAITAQTLGKQFMTAATGGVYAHAVPSGSNLALVVTVGTTGSTVTISSVQWDPDTTVSGNEQTVSCTGNQVVMGTNRRIAICLLLSPTSSSGNGQITIAFSGGSDTFTSSAITFSGVAGLRTTANSGNGFEFSTWTACTAGTGNYTCSLSVSTAVDDVVFDIVGQGEPDPAGSRSFTAGASQTKHDDSPTLSSGAHLRIATSTAIASGTTTTMSWTYGGATGTNGVGQVAIALMPASTVTAARLGARAAVSYGAAGTRISWRTEEEASHLGFRVWRERSGQRAPVSPGLIPGSTFATGTHPLAGGRGYELWDQNRRLGDRYWLEEIAAHGPARWHGPIVATTASAREGRSARRSASASLAPATVAAPAVAAPVPLTVPRGSSGEPTVASACANPPASRAAVKISVSTTGWVHVGAADLTAAGLPAGVDPSTMALWADGQPVGLLPVGGRELEAVEFYGQAPDTRETGTRIYWLTWGGTPADASRSIPHLAPASDAGQTATGYLAEVTARERSLYFAALLNGPADNFFGAVVSSAPVSQSIGAADPLPGQPATLVVALQGATADAHQVTVTLDGTELGTVSWSGQAAAVQEFAVPPDLLADGANTVLLSPAAGNGVALVDHLTVRYPRPFRAVADQLEAVAPAGSRVVMTGFSRPDVRAFDVTDAGAPVELDAVPLSTADGYGAAVQLPPGGSPRILRAQSTAGLAAPDAVTANLPSTICQTAGAEVAVIAPRSFFPALAPWVAARRAVGWSVELDDVEDLFDEMTYGAHHAAALTDLVRLRRSGPSSRTRYLLLAGGASIDPRNFLAKDVPDLVPTALIDTDAIETASDERLADLDGDGIAELAVGRWPSRTAEDLSALVTATLALDGQGPFDRGSLLVTGADGDPSFQTSADAVAAVLATAPDRYDPSGLTSDGAAAGLVARWSASPSFVQYFGHGSEQIWEGLLSVDGVAALGQGGRRAVVSAMTCLNGLFQDVYQECLAESLLRAPSGAVAVWASADLYDAGAQSALAASFAAAARTMALGAAAHAARLATGGAGRAMIFFGDPTLFGTPSADPPAGGGDASAGPDASAPANAPDAGSTGGTRSGGCAVAGRSAPGGWPAPIALFLAACSIRRRRTR